MAMRFYDDNYNGLMDLPNKIKMDILVDQPMHVDRGRWWEEERFYA